MYRRHYSFVAVRCTDTLDNLSEGMVTKLGCNSPNEVLQIKRKSSMSSLRKCRRTKPRTDRALAADNTLLLAGL